MLHEREAEHRLDRFSLSISLSLGAVGRYGSVLMLER